MIYWHKNDTKVVLDTAVEISATDAFGAKATCEANQIRVMLIGQEGGST